MALARAALAAAALALAGCGDGAAPPPARTASDWLDVAGMRCGDGTPTGIAISRGRSDAVLVYLAPGGACWSATACRADVKAFGEADYESARLLLGPGSLLDRALADNPFATWTQVFVPYCTGDVHLGQTVRTYGTSPPATWEHHGWPNLQAAVATITAELPRPASLVVAGSSAGGLGALAAYDLLRDVWDPSGGTSAALLDDSGPTFVGTAVPEALLAAWWDAWGLDSTIAPRCPACAPRSRPGGEGDLSALWAVLAGDARRPHDRLALLSTTQDATMRGFFADPGLGLGALGPLDFQQDLDALATRLAALGANVASLRVGGTSAYRHPLLLGAPSFLEAPDGPVLLGWLSALLVDPAWTSTTITTAY